MDLLHIVSPAILVASFVWVLLLLRRHKDPGLLFIAATIGFIAVYEFLESLGVPGVGSPGRERFWLREIPARTFGLLVVYFMSRSMAQRARAEERLRDGDMAYKVIFDSASDPIIVLDRQSLLITDLNQAACDKYGYQREELLGINITRLSTDPEKTEESIVLAQERVPLRYHRKKEGTVFPVEIVTSSFSQNNKDYMVGILRDISAQVNANERLKRFNEALGQLSRSNVLEKQGLQAAFRQITEVTSRALDVERVSIWLFDENRTKIICQDLYLRSDHEHDDGAELAAIDYPSYFASLIENRTIAVNDAHGDPRTREFSENFLKPLGIVSTLDAPIRFLGKNIGVVCNEQVGEPRQWSPEEETFVASIADFLTMVIETSESRKSRKSTERLAEILQLTTDFVGITNVDGHSPFMNSGGRKMLGIAETENISNLTAREFLPDAAWKTYREEVLPLVMIDGIWSGETSLRKRDGNELTVSQVMIGHRNGAGKIEYLSTIMRDISDQKRAEQALRQSEERFRALYEDNPSMYFIVDASGIVSSVNRYGAEHLGFTVKELVGKPVLGVFHEDDKALVANCLESCLRQPDKIAEWEFRKLRKNGSLTGVRE